MAPLGGVLLDSDLADLVIAKLTADAVLLLGATSKCFRTRCEDETLWMRLLREKETPMRNSMACRIMVPELLLDNRSLVTKTADGEHFLVHVPPDVQTGELLVIAIPRPADAWIDDVLDRWHIGWKRRYMLHAPITAAECRSVSTDGGHELGESLTAKAFADEFCFAVDFLERDTLVGSSLVDPYLVLENTDGVGSLTLELTWEELPNRMAAQSTEPSENGFIQGFYTPRPDEDANDGRTWAIDPTHRSLQMEVFVKRAHDGKVARFCALAVDLGSDMTTFVDQRDDPNMDGYFQARYETDLLLPTSPGSRDVARSIARQSAERSRITSFFKPNQASPKKRLAAHMVVEMFVDDETEEEEEDTTEGRREPGTGGDQATLEPRWWKWHSLTLYFGMEEADNSGEDASPSEGEEEVRELEAITPAQMAAMLCEDGDLVWK